MTILIARQAVKVIATARSERCRSHRVRACGISRMIEPRTNTLMMSLGLADRICSREESQSRPRQARKDKLAAARLVRLASLESAHEIKRAHWLKAKNAMMACLLKCVHDLAHFASCLRN